MKTLTHSLALVVMMASNAWAALPAPMPKFMDANELAYWRAEMAEQSAAKDAAQANADALAADQSFYTGKPYLPATGSYAFKYRSYQPELARWTSEDPSGFPDGANHQIYNNNPLTGLDALGLAWTDRDFINHFYRGGGRDVSLSEMGLLEQVKSHCDAGQGRATYNFGRQIDSKAGNLSKPYDGEFSDSFERSYDFEDVVYSMGSGTVRGDFNGNITSTPLSSGGGIYTYEGTASIFYNDTFTDPLSIIQRLYGSSSSPNAPDWLRDLANVGGTPYMIVGMWTKDYNGSGEYE
jgi:RHS repeat-associated protein